MVRAQRKAKLIGLGLDNDDGEIRITKGENFHLMGGSEETHQCMQEKCVKFNEKLTAKGKQLGELEQKELLDLASECKMNVLPLDRRPEQKRTGG